MRSQPPQGHHLPGARQRTRDGARPPGALCAGTAPRDARCAVSHRPRQPPGGSLNLRPRRPLLTEPEVGAMTDAASGRLLPGLPKRRLSGGAMTSAKEQETRPGRAGIPTRQPPAGCGGLKESHREATSRAYHRRRIRRVPERAPRQRVAGACEHPPGMHAHERAQATVAPVELHVHEPISTYMASPGQVSKTYVPGASTIGRSPPPPSSSGAGLSAPHRSPSHASRSGHQLPGSVSAVFSQSSGSAGVLSLIW